MTMKMAQMMHLVLFGPIVSFFFHIWLMLTNNIDVVNVLKGREGDKNENGPNDTSGIIWAHSKSFFFFFPYLINAN